VLPARGGEDGPEQTREVVGVETGQPIVRAGELGGAIEADPGPPERQVRVSAGRRRKWASFTGP